MMCVSGVMSYSFNLIFLYILKRSIKVFKLVIINARVAGIVCEENYTSLGLAFNQILAIEFIKCNLVVKKILLLGDFFHSKSSKICRLSMAEPSYM